MSDDLIQRAREALVDVTPGPWKEFIDDSSGQWTGWPLSIDATSIEDKCVVRTGGQWPYEWDAKTSQHEACANASFIAAARDLVPAMADRIEAQEALRKEAVEALEDARQSLVDSAEEIAELRLTLSKTDLELPWLSDAIDKQTIALAKLRQHLGETE